jgi:hypothetical protein
MTNTLNPGDQLTAGQQLQSNNGLYALVMQNDGNLVLYQGSATAGIKKDRSSDLVFHRVSCRSARLVSN